MSYQCPTVSHSPDSPTVSHTVPTVPQQSLQMRHAVLRCVRKLMVQGAKAGNQGGGQGWLSESNVSKKMHCWRSVSNHVESQGQQGKTT